MKAFYVADKQLDRVTFHRDGELPTVSESVFITAADTDYVYDDWTDGVLLAQSSGKGKLVMVLFRHTTVPSISDEDIDLVTKIIDSIRYH